jgi:uncharacterized membrane protein YccC
MTWGSRAVAAARGFATPGARLVDELECAASVLLAIAFGHLAGAQNISWAAFSGFMVMRSHAAETLWRGVLRIAGTGLGALLALAVTPLVRSSPALSAAALAVVGAISLYAAMTRRHSYAWLFVGLTFQMILLDEMRHPAHAALPFARTRVIENVAGTATCVLVSLASTLTLRRRWPGAPTPAPARLGWQPDAARHAVQAGIALAVLPFLALVSREPDLAQGAVTIMAVMLVPAAALGASGLSPVSRRVVLRVAGCAAGAIYAGIVLALAHLSPLATAPVLLAGTTLGVMLGRHVENGAGALAYAGTQVVLAILVTLVPDSYARVELTPALDRLGGILIGMVLLEPVLLAWHLLASARRGAGGDKAEAGGV